MNIQDLADSILQKQSELSVDRGFLVAVSGIDGSGKGYITEKLITALNHQNVNAVSINLDAWHKLPSERFNSENLAQHFYHHAFHFDDLFQQLILPLKNQRMINLTTVLTGITGISQTYNYQFENVDVIVLEGIFLLKRSLQHFYDFKIWIDCSFATALERAIQRNQEGIPLEQIIDDYQKIYFPAQKEHLSIDNPKSIADVIYINDFKLV
ncbi:uridine kinase [Anabaena sphaerica FACHB-251]|uniref:Uridine kinase n=1 Tax=Anabaena sphaerica FACHB-251 TaxID=2692883 RepID=A0A926WJJ5_9NOST|nr:uridine kinase [Anabaena sphaerica]MBD2295740.1 uridine kinase [Anabaena sphaerica FACHB-251]